MPNKHDFENSKEEIILSPFLYEITEAKANSKSNLILCKVSITFIEGVSYFL
ncbi:MAG: hypothetical protein ACTSPI_13720 [Candidatus Heimdallarchaeaceae archaeon]